MEFRRGAAVYTPDGEKVGIIERVVLDPHSKEVTHVVVHKGLLLPEEKVVPISLLGPATDDRVTLREGPYDFEDLPPFEETEFVAAGVQTARTQEVTPESREEGIMPAAFAQAYYWYPPLGVNWWSGIGYPAGVEPEFIRTEQINIPKGTVALEEGARVVGSDEKEIGKVDEVLTDLETDRVTHFVISEGLILKVRKLIPANWVDGVLEDRILLSVPSQVVEDLPDYEEAA